LFFDDDRFPTASENRQQAENYGTGNPKKCDYASTDRSTDHGSGVFGAGTISYLAKLMPIGEQPCGHKQIEGPKQEQENPTKKATLANFPSDGTHRPTSRCFSDQSYRDFHHAATPPLGRRHRLELEEATEAWFSAPVPSSVDFHLPLAAGRNRDLAAAGNKVCCILSNPPL
jgi:hypothetical protein